MRRPTPPTPPPAGAAQALLQLESGPVEKDLSAKPRIRIGMGFLQQADKAAEVCRERIARPSLLRPQPKGRQQEKQG